MQDYIQIVTMVMSGCGLVLYSSQSQQIFTHDDDNYYY